MRRPLNQAGYTLVEVVIAVSVSALLIGVVTTFAMSNLINSAILTARLNLQSEAQLALDLMSNDIRLAAVADEKNRWQDENAPSAPGDLFSWESDSDTLVLATVAEDQDRNIIFADASKYISHKNNSVYYVQDGVLYKRLIAAEIPDNSATTTCPSAAASPSCPEDRELLNDVVDFGIKYLNSDGIEVIPVEARSVELAVKLQTRKAGQTITADYATRMVFRNE